MPMSSSTPTKRRGRPPQGSLAPEQTRAAILQAGLEILSEQGVTATGIDQVLKKVGVPKGSFYHYFASKDIFLQAVVAAYSAYFNQKLDKHFSQQAITPLQRLASFLADTESNMVRYQYCRGCLIGNMGQEVSALSDALRTAVEAVLVSWEQRLARLLQEAVEHGEISPQTDCQLEAAFFWIGWEGAVMRAKLRRDTAPMALFLNKFLQRLAT